MGHSDLISTSAVNLLSTLLFSVQKLAAA